MEKRLQTIEKSANGAEKELATGNKVRKRGGHMLPAKKEERLPGSCRNQKDYSLLKALPSENGAAKESTQRAQSNEWERVGCGARYMERSFRKLAAWGKCGGVYTKFIQRRFLTGLATGRVIPVGCLTEVGLEKRTPGHHRLNREWEKVRGKGRLCEMVARKGTIKGIGKAR